MEKREQFQGRATAKASVGGREPFRGLDYAAILALPSASRFEEGRRPACRSRCLSFKKALPVSCDISRLSHLRITSTYRQSSIDFTSIRLDPSTVFDESPIALIETRPPHLFLPGPRVSSSDRLHVHTRPPSCLPADNSRSSELR